MAKKQSNTVQVVSRSDFAESFFYLNGAPFSLDEYAFMRTIYNVNPRRMVTLKTARQVSKSSTLANIIISNSCLLMRDPEKGTKGSMGFRSLYVSPSADQTKIFSYDRLTPVVMESPFIKKRYFSRALRNNVFTKTLTNGSNIYLRYALLSPDRLRGLSVDSICWDESQDLLLDTMEVVRQALFTSKYKWEWVVGTPKRRTGTLAKYWKESTQNEWAVKCLHCSKYNILTEQNIGLQGPICRYCGGLLDPRMGQWVCTNPSAREKANINEGFRVSQLQFANAPWLNWQQDILHKYNTEGRAIFYNEILGLEYDDGVTPISINEIKACCKDSYINGQFDGPARGTYMGIDWGPANSTDSYTVVAIITVNEYLIPTVVFLKRFVGAEANFENMHQTIPELAAQWNVSIIGADRGMGEASNAELRLRHGKDKVVEFMYSASLKQQFPSWNGKSRFYTLNRNYELSTFFNKVKKKQIVLPKYESIEHPFVDDMTAIAVDYDEKHNKVAYINSEPDDTVHAIIFGLLAAKIGDAFESIIIY